MCNLPPLLMIGKLVRIASLVLIGCGVFGRSTQSHYREVPWWEIFMEQELRFGLDLGRFGNFWGWFFHVFMGKKKFKNIVYKSYSKQFQLVFSLVPTGPNTVQISIPVSLKSPTTGLLYNDFGHRVIITNFLKLCETLL